MATAEIITNGTLTLSVDTNMRVDSFVQDSISLWSKTDDTITYKDSVSGNTKSFVLKNLTWTITKTISGSDETVQGIASYTDVDGVVLKITYKYLLATAITYATATVDIVSDTELHFIRASHLGRATVNNIIRNPRYVFQKDLEIDYLDYADDAALQAVWSGTVTPTRTVDNMGGDSTAAMQIVMTAGTHTISKSILSEDWTEVNTIFAGINAKALTGDNHKIRLYWVSGSVTYYSKYRVIDAGEPYKSNWRLFHLRHFYLDILTGINKSSVTEFGFEIVTDGATLIIDEIWRYGKQDILSTFEANQTDFYDVLPFFNVNVPWDRRQCEEVFSLAYADETGVGGALNGVAWIGEWRPTSDIVKVELDSSANSKPLSIGGQIKYTPSGLTMKHWSAKWFILPFAANTAVATMYTNAKNLYESFMSDLTFDTPSAPGAGELSVQPYLWNGLEDPLNILIPKLRRYADAGVTDLLIPMGNSGWGSWKSRVWRYDLANTVREKGDDRLYFILNAWIDPLYPERRVFLEATIFDNHWMKDERDEVTTFSDVTQGEGRVFVYESSDAREYYARRAYLPINPTWFNDQVVDGVTYVFSYQYPVFRPSLGHISRTGSFFGKDINIHDRWLERVQDVIDGYNISGIVLSEWFWYKRGFDSNSLTLYNAYRTSQSLPVLTEFDRENNGLPAATGTNEYIADDTVLWDWKNTETATIISAVEALFSPGNLKLWISGNIDNISGLKDPAAAPWSGVDMFNGTPTGDNAFTHDNVSHSTGFDQLNANPKLDMVWAWNYWGYSRLQAIVEFISFYKNHKSKISMALGLFPGSSPPPADELLEAIILSRIAGFNISFVGDRNYSEAHFLAMEEGLTSEAIYRRLGSMITKTPATLVRITIDAVAGTGQAAGTYLFSEQAKPLHLENPTTAIPLLSQDISFGQEIKQNVTLVESVNLVFFDNAETIGFFWLKWKAANPYYINRKIEVLKGFAGSLESTYNTVFKGTIQNIKTLNNGKVEIQAKSLLKLTDVKIPRETDGELGADPGAAGTTVTLKAGTDMTQYEDPVVLGRNTYIKIQTDMQAEIIEYTGISGTSFTGCSRGLFQIDKWSAGAAYPTVPTEDIVVQQVRVFEDLNPIDVIEELLGDAGLDDTPTTGDIDNAAGGSFLAIKTNWFTGRLVRGVIDTPVAIKTLLRELREITLTSLFQNANQQIEISYLAPPPIGANPKRINDNDNIIFLSSAVDDTFSRQVTRIVTYFNLIGGRAGSEDNDYLNKLTYVDSARESRYGKEKQIKIKSRWLKSDLLGKDFARIISKNYIRVVGDGLQTITFDVETKDDNLQVGDLFFLTTSKITDTSGNTLQDVKFYVFKKEQVAANRWRYRAYNSRLIKKICYIAPSGHPDYTASTAEEKEYGYLSNNSGLMSDGSDGYSII